MLRLWVTLYYGFCLFQLGPLTAVSGQSTQTPAAVFWKGSSVTFYKYSDDGTCNTLATNASYIGTDQQNGWLGGLDKLTFKMDSTTCLKVPTRKIGDTSKTYVKMRFSSGATTCSVGYNSGAQYDFLFFSDSECRMGTQQSSVDFYTAGGQMIPRDGECFYDRGDAAKPIYYRVFCDITLPPTSVVYNITTFVPTIVKPEDIMAMLLTLVVRNASFFKANNFIPTPEAPTEPVIRVLNITANTPPPSKSSGSDTEAFLTHVTLWGLFLLAVSFC
jgi:hypothetical protein